MSRAHAFSQKTISLDLHKALDGKYCQRKTGMLEKKGMNAPPRPKRSRTIAGITSSQNGPSSHIASGKAGSKKIPSRGNAVFRRRRFYAL